MDAPKNPTVDTCDAQIGHLCFDYELADLIITFGRHAFEMAFEYLPWIINTRQGHETDFLGCRCSKFACVCSLQERAKGSHECCIAEKAAQNGLHPVPGRCTTEKSGIAHCDPGFVFSGCQCRHTGSFDLAPRFWQRGRESNRGSTFCL